MVWIRNLIAELQIVPLSDLTLGQDNVSSIKLHTEQTKGKRSKHILTKVQYIKELVKSSVLVIEWVPTALMTADALTKPLQGSLFFEHNGKILGFDYIEKFA
jgi:hypothetical protein